MEIYSSLLGVNITAVWAGAKPQPPNDTNQTPEGWATAALCRTLEGEALGGAGGAVTPPDVSCGLFPRGERCSLKTRRPVWEPMHREVGRAVCSPCGEASRRGRIECEDRSGPLHCRHTPPPHLIGKMCLPPVYLCFFPPDIWSTCVGRVHQIWYRFPPENLPVFLFFYCRGNSQQKRNDRHFQRLNTKFPVLLLASNHYLHLFVSY